MSEVIPAASGSWCVIAAGEIAAYKDPMPSMTGYTSKRNELGRGEEVMPDGLRSGDISGDGVEVRTF